MIMQQIHTTPLGETGSMSGRFFSVSDFAKLSQSTRATLHHYDKLGLLSPVSRGTNKYRYYSSEQLSVVSLIQTLQALGVTLDEMKKLRSQRTPEQMNTVLNYPVWGIFSKERVKLGGLEMAGSLLFLQPGRSRPKTGRAVYHWLSARRLWPDGRIV